MALLAAGRAWPRRHRLNERAPDQSWLQANALPAAARLTCTSVARRGLVSPSTSTLAAFRLSKPSLPPRRYALVATCRNSETLQVGDQGEWEARLQALKAGLAAPQARTPWRPPPFPRPTAQPTSSPCNVLLGPEARRPPAQPLLSTQATPARLVPRVWVQRLAAHPHAVAHHAAAGRLVRVKGKRETGHLRQEQAGNTWRVNQVSVGLSELKANARPDTCNGGSQLWDEEGTARGQVATWRRLLTRRA